MRILVTGGAGFIGSHLVDALVFRGDQVWVLDNLQPQVHRGRKPCYLNPKADYLFENLMDLQTLEKAAEGVEAIIHLAALVGVGQSMYEIVRYMEGNTLATAKLMEWLIRKHRGKAPIKRLVVASSMSIYGEGLYRCPQHGEISPPPREVQHLNRHRWEPLCPSCGKELTPVATPERKPLQPTSVYAISKKDQEELCLTLGQAYGIPTVALRFFNVFGPRQSLFNPYTGACAIFSARLRHGKPPVLYEDGRQTRDFVHVSDIAQAILLALEHPGMVGQALNVGTGRAVSIREIAETLAQAYGSPLTPKIVGRYRSGDIRHCFADISRLSAFGYHPNVTLEEGLKALVRWGAMAEAEDLFEMAEQQLVEKNLLGD